MTKTAVVYTFHEYNDCVEFFVKHGLFQSDTVDFFFVINSFQCTINLYYPNVKSYNRENTGHDFGAWSYCIFKEDLIDKYDYFIFINSSVKGPYLPLWHKSKLWTDLFISNINETVKLFGTSIGNYDGNIHVQSMLLVTDKIGLRIGIENNIFSPNIVKIDRWDVIVQKELGYSKCILQNNYNIGCLLTVFQDIDFRTDDPFRGQNLNVFGHDDYYGIEVHPYEVIFIKIPKFGHENLFKVVDRLSIWKKTYNNYSPRTKGEEDMSFDWKEYLKANRDVSLIENSESFATNHFKQYAKKEGRKLRPDGLKHWELYAALNPDILYSFSDKRSIIHHYEIHGKNEGRKTSISNFDADKFHWIYYKFENNIPDIVTNIQSLYHYIHIGRNDNLQYYSLCKKKYYLVDLNPLSTSGLFNQIISLINGILLAWCCNRDLYVTGFYQNYNQQRKIPLKDVIDIQYLNNMLQIEGINVTVSEDYKNKSWVKSRLYNAAKVDFNHPDYNHLRGTLDSEPLFQKKLILMLKYLYPEKEEYIDIGDTFDYFLFRENIDETLKDIFRNLIVNIKYNHRLYEVRDHCINKMGLNGKFSAIHFRIEDDIIFHRPDKSVPESEYGEKIKENYMKYISKHFNKQDVIYLSTFLLKGPNKYNYLPLVLKNQYSNVRFWQKPKFYWRNDFKDLIEGREIDAIIDYLICLKADKFVGFNGSTFSEIIKYYFEFHGKSVDIPTFN